MAKLYMCSQDLKCGNSKNMESNSAGPFLYCFHVNVFITVTVWISSLSMETEGKDFPHWAQKDNETHT